MENAELNKGIKAAKKAGRPKGAVSGNTVSASIMKAYHNKVVKKELKNLLRAQIDIAKGIVVQKRIELPNGKVIEKYYTEKPNEQAIEDLLDRSIGKPAETQKVEGTVTLVIDE